MDRLLGVELYNILDLISCASDYGFDDDIIMTAFAEWIDSLPDEDIEGYASFYVSQEGREQGYSEEDRDKAVEVLKAFREQYIK